MKNILILVFVSAFLISFQVSADQATAMSSGCLACHKADGKLIGPSFKEIAGKYAGQPGIVDNLATKVKAGGKGVWGDVEMPASPAPLDDVKKVIAWMLTHK